MGFDILLRALLPTQYQARVWERSYQQEVVVNWLEIEVDADAPKRMPVLYDLKGWRNIEVYCYVRYEMPDWTARAME